MYMEELIKKEVSNENGEHVGVENKVTYLLLSGDRDFQRKFLFNRGKH